MTVVSLFAFTSVEKFIQEYPLLRAPAYRWRRRGLSQMRKFSTAIFNQMSPKTNLNYYSAVSPSSDLRQFRGTETKKFSMATSMWFFGVEICPAISRLVLSETS
ncbi:hypothetical protein U1Q18_035665 [Sarracenia purpurea var. burkii]